VTLGYAAQARTGWARQLWVLLTTYPDVLAAAAAFGLLLTAGLTSIRIARRRLAYETWWAVHLYIYLAIGLSLAHQVATGASFVGHPLTRTIWLTAWFVTAGMVLAFRVGLPIARSLRHQLRVEQVRAEAPGTFSVICRGRKLDRLAVSGGQFFQWRFLTRGLWWHAHPYSLSALPRPPYIRVTVRGLGDHSHAIARLRPGTRVAIEGPYGAFTRHARAGDQLALIGAGVGMTPLLALLEDLPPSADVVVIARASSPEHLVHRDEVAALVRRRGGRYHEVTGPRERVPLDERALRRLIPDLAHRDIYVCGPDGFSAGVMAAAQRLGAPADRIHCEAFAF
jgi:ferredoxin-NADP reductase